MPNFTAKPIDSKGYGNTVPCSAVLAMIDILTNALHKRPISVMRDFFVQKQRLSRLESEFTEKIWLPLPVPLNVGVNACLTNVAVAGQER